MRYGIVQQMQTGIRCVALSLLVAVAGAFFSEGSASAVTLMVNGDTPSVRWQRVADQSRVPTPSGTISLYLSDCPDAAVDAVYATSCAPLAQRAVWLAPLGPEQAQTSAFHLRHELGHHFDHQFMTAAAKVRFAKIWKRPTNLDWWAPLRPQANRPGPSFGLPTSDSGEGSTAGEWFADAYAICAMDPLSDARGIDWLTFAAYLPIPTYTNSDQTAALRTLRQVRRTCYLIREVAAS